MLASLQVQLLLGTSVPSPASRALMLALSRVRIQQDDDGPILFSLTFQAPPSAKFSVNNPITSDPSLKPFSRAVVVVTLNNASAQVVLDGFITHQQQAPGDFNRPAAFTVTGEDASVMMSLKTPFVEHVGLDLAGVARKILGAYTRYGVRMSVTDPTLQDPPTPEEQTRLQTVDDRTYLVNTASECGFVFYVTPGPSVGQSVAHWGPRVTQGTVQSALSVDLGSSTNVEALDFEYRPLDAVLVNAEAMDIDGTTAQVTKVTTTGSSTPALSVTPGLSALGDNVRVGPVDHAGASVARSRMLAQAKTDDSSAEVVVARGKLSVLRYGAVLQARKLVGVRGAGGTFDGTYRVKSVVHDISRGRYTQSFTLTREGLDAQSSTVKP